MIRSGIDEDAVPGSLTIGVRFRDGAELCGWSWDIRDGSGAIVADSWNDEWMVYDTPAHALAAATTGLAALREAARTHGNRDE